MRIPSTTARLALAGVVALAVLGGPLPALRASAVPGDPDAAEPAVAEQLEPMPTTPQPTVSDGGEAPQGDVEAAAVSDESDEPDVADDELEPAPTAPQPTVSDGGAAPQGDVEAAAVSDESDDPDVADDELEPAPTAPQPTVSDGGVAPQEDLAAAAQDADDQEPGLPSSPPPADADSAEVASAPTMTDEVLPVSPPLPEATPAMSLIDDGTLPLSLSLDGCTVSVTVGSSVPAGALLTIDDSWTYQFQGSVQPGQAVTFVLGSDSQIDPSTAYVVQAHLTAPGGYDEIASRAFDVTVCINPDAEMASLQLWAEATGDPPDNDVAVDIFSAPDCGAEPALFVTSVTIDYGTFAVLEVPAIDLCISPERLMEADSVEVIGGTAVSFGPDLEQSRTIMVAWPDAPEPTDPPGQPDPTVPDPTVPDPTVADSTLPDPTVPDPTVPDPTLPDPTVPDPTVGPTDTPARGSGGPTASTTTFSTGTSAPTPSPPPAPQPGELPQTGASATLAVIAVVILAIGAAFVRLGGRRQRGPS